MTIITSNVLSMAICEAFGIDTKVTKVTRVDLIVGSGSASSTVDVNVCIDLSVEDLAKISDAVRAKSQKEVPKGK